MKPMFGMKHLAVVLSLMTALTASAQRKQCIDADWHFLYGDGSSAVSNAAIMILIFFI